jgi:hypothetical protein
MPTPQLPQLLHYFITAGGPLGGAALLIWGLIRLAKVMTPHVVALLGERQRLQTSVELAKTRPDDQIEITPERIAITPKNLPARRTAVGADLASLRSDRTPPTPIESKRKPS